MKLFKLALMIVVTATFALAARPSDARIKWKGNWYLRGANVCKEITLDRKGKTTLGIYPKAIVEKKETDYFLTVESMGKKYTYEMSERSPSDFDLELISVGPNLPLPKKEPAQDAYTAIFRMMVDCQATIVPEVKEESVR